MPKVKTKRAAAKRFVVKASGAVKRAHAGKRHLMRKKNRARLNKLKKNALVHPADMNNVMACLPNG